MTEPDSDSAAFRVREWLDGRTTMLDDDDVREVYATAERAGRDLDNARGELRAVHAEKHRFRTERDAAVAEVARYRSFCGEAHCGDIERDRDFYESKVERMQDLLGSIYLYVKWRWLTKQLTTEQKEMWADAVDAWRERLRQAEGDEDPGLRVERWWRDDFVEGSDG